MPSPSLPESFATLTDPTTVEAWLRAVAEMSHSLAGAPELAPFPLGTLLGQGRFVVGEIIGRGGMGAVYNVHDGQRGADLALKLLLDASPERLLAFKNEFRALQDLRHRNLVRLDELFEEDGRWFFTMERVRGIPFTDHARAGGVEPARLRAALLQLVRGLLALHDADKVHRDVKPSNTLVEAGGRVVLLDFGLVGDARSPHDVLLPGAGTVAYMAPEQVRGGSGRPADWYSVGVMLYQSLTGVLPFDGPPQRIIARKLAEPAPPPGALVADLPPDLERLCADLLERDPDRRPDGQEILARIEERPRAFTVSAGTARDGQFVGRRRELAVLRTALAETGRGRATTVFIRGESGIGKTALLDAFVGELAAPALALAGRCYEREFVPFKALDGAIDALARHLDNLEDAALRRLLPPGGALARIFPVLRRACHRAGIVTEDAPPANATDARSAAFRALQQLLGMLARRGPIVLAIDDLHWADVDSLRALEDLMHGPQAPPILLVLVARLETTIPPLSGAHIALELGPLAADEAHELARRLAGDRHGRQPAALSWLAEESGRRPLFMEAMFRHGAGAAGGPVRLEDALAARVVALAPAGRAVVEVVSLAVQPLTTGAVARATGAATEALFPVVRDLQGDRLVRSGRDGDALAIEPYHDQVRRAVVSAMSPDRQRHCHRAIAEALELSTPSASESLAVHWRLAGDPARARPHTVNAGHRARAVLAFDRAATFYRSAIDLHSDPADVPSELHRWHAEALAHAGRAGESAAAYDAAAGRTTGYERTDLARLAAEHLLRAGDLDAGLIAVDRTLASHGMSRPRSMAAAARMLIQEKVLEACAAVTRRLIPLGPRRAAAMARKADACWTTWLGLSAFDPLSSAVFLARFVRLSRRLGDPKRLALALCLRAPLGTFAGPPARAARRALAEARSLMGDQPEPLLDGYHTLSSCAVSYLLGHFEQALAYGERAMAAFRQCAGPVGFELAMAERYVIDSLWHAGHFAALRERTAATWREASQRGDRYLVAQIETTVLPVVHLADDDVAGATAALDSALTRWPRLPLSIIDWQQATLRAAVALYAARPGEALRLMETLKRSPEHRLFMRVGQLRVFTLFAHASALIGVAAAAAAASKLRPALLRRAERMARRLERTRMADDFTALLRGQISLLRRPDDDGGDHAAAELFAHAETLFARRGLRVTSLVAAYGVGIAMGGDAGRRRAHDAAQRLRAETIRTPEGVVRAYAPALA